MRWVLLSLGFAVAVAASPAVADKGMLQITSKPGGGVVIIDGKRKGNIPAEPGQSFPIQLPEGDHIVEVVVPINEDLEHYGKTSVFVADDTVQPVAVTLGKRLAGPERERLQKLPPPKMVTISAGTFMMGSEVDSKEKRVHRVTISKPFELAVTPVTFDQWDACLADGGCGGYKPADGGWGRGTRPVINVSWNDAQSYVRWLNDKTGKRYRLPTEAEWEYAARAGTTTKYWWGGDIGKNNANCARCGSQWDKKMTAPVGSFKPNSFGLYDMAGNVVQWVEDCSHDNYTGAPVDGSAWATGDCYSRVLRGGSWNSYPYFLRSAVRYWIPPDNRYNNFGFRVARTITP